MHWTSLIADALRVGIAALLLFGAGALVVIVVSHRRNNGYVDPVILAQLRADQERLYPRKHQRQRP